jgi:hypothetical protein
VYIFSLLLPLFSSDNCQQLVHSIYKRTGQRLLWAIEKKPLRTGEKKKRRGEKRILSVCQFWRRESEGRQGDLALP